ncbi:echinoderm microtubule-associated protein-like 6 isoform X2 [Macrobrachium rosenbergii]|uniref:echinoderm microtubule-associated protein-like 6 isoform X2 n=1 Tax=Macrobrachium rosenbergii TaxID=79674 RepID=UPI0034D5DEFE
MTTRRPPVGSLKLEWVFGYNGHTARNNVKTNKLGHLVYYVAGVGVVHDAGFRRQTFYTGHSDDITSLAVDSKGEMAATGQVGKDAYITVWDAVTCEPVSVMHDGHAGKVSALAFSADGEYLASVGGPEGKQELMIWEWKKGRRIAKNVAYQGRVEEVEWEPGSATKLVTCGEKHVRFWKLRGNVLQNNAGIFGGESPHDQLSLSHMEDGRIITGTALGHLFVWLRHKLVNVIRDVHPGGVLAIEVYPGGLLTGGKDGSIAMFDKELNKINTVPAPSLVYEVPGPIHSLATFGDKLIFGTEKNEIWMVTTQPEGNLTAACIVQGHGLGEVWGLATHPSRPIAVTASDDQTVRLWNLEDHIPLTTTVLNDEARAVAFSPDGQQVSVGLKKGTFLVLMEENLEEIHRITDRKEVRHDLKYSPCGAFLAVASNDNFVDIYAVESGYKRIQILSGASSFITHIDWSSNSDYMQINSGASERLIYNVVDEKIVDESDIPDVEWSSWTGVLGSQVAGLWHKYSDVSDINAADANFYYNCIVTGDDYGLVKLFRFPCPKRGSKCQSFVGHSEHVTNVRWTNDSEFVVSVGGADHAVFLWRFRPNRKGTPGTNRVQIPEKVQELSDDDAIDTEDELEGIPELTLDLEEEMSSVNTMSRQKNKRSTSATPGVEIAKDSAFAKRRDAVGHDLKANVFPEQSLSIKHVFGYRAHECRDNAHWLKDEHIVYHVAAVGVVLDLKTKTQSHYLHHTDDILCLAVHPEGVLVATGQIGRDAVVHVWDGLNQKIMSLLKNGHSKGVSSVAFSADGERVASLGLDDHHTLIVWNWKKGYKLASARGYNDKVFGIRFSPTNSNRLLSYGAKHIKLWNQAGGGLTYRQVAMGSKFKQETVLCCSAGVDDGSGEWWVLGLSCGYVFLIKDGVVERSFRAHKVPVYSILVTKEFIWTAGQGGYVCKWDQEMKKCLKVFPVTDHFLEESTPVSLMSSQPGIRSLSVAAGSDVPLLVGTQHSELLLMDDEGKISLLVQGHGKGEVWGLDTHPLKPEAVTVGDDNSLRRWDLVDRLPLGSANLRKTARCVHFHPTAAFLVVGFLDGSIAMYLYPSLEKQGGAQHRSEGISDVKFSPDGRFLAAGSHESVVDLYVVDTDGDIVSKESSGLKRVGICRGASSWITHITWHKDSRLLQINSGAGEELYYEAPHGTRQLIRDSTASDLAWIPPMTCVLDVTVEGVWSTDMDLTDVNAVATAHKLPVVATANDAGGLVRLFAYPCKGGFKKHRQYRAHSSHVTNVRWSFDDELVITTGGADTAVIVWQVRNVLATDEEGRASPSESAHRPSSLDDLPDEEITMTDLEAAGLEDEEDVLSMSQLAETLRKRTLPKIEPEMQKEPQPPIVELTGLKERLKSLPLLTADDETIFYCSGSAIGRLKITDGGDVVSQELGYGEHETPVTALTISAGEPVMVATAQVNKEQLAIDELYDEDQETDAALIHVWRPSDGANVAVLRGGAENVITSLSFSPSGRFLASLADAANVHVFNWIKGVHIANLTLRTGMAIAIAHSGETTVAALSPRALLFLDLVGNSLVTTRGKAPPDLLPDEAAFNGLGVAPNGNVYVACSDGSVVEWKGRIAVRYVSPPEEPEFSPPYRMAIAVGQGAVFTACRLDSSVIIRCYTTDTEKLTFFSDSKIAVPTQDWTPITAQLGSTMIILGGRKQQPFIILDLKSGKFTLIEQGT